MFTAYGHTFQDEKTLNAYKAMKANSRTKALARKKSMSDDDKERASIRKHFASEAKHFKI